MAETQSEQQPLLKFPDVEAAKAFANKVAQGILVSTNEIDAQLSGVNSEERQGLQTKKEVLGALQSMLRPIRASTRADQVFRALEEDLGTQFAERLHSFAAKAKKNE